MPEYCLTCDYEDELEALREPVTVNVRGEPIEVTKEFYKCPACGESFISSRGHDMFNEAYREYRRRHDMLQPESIIQLRQQYGLTQEEFSTLLGWETSTLSRYENGALQEESQDTLLKLATKAHDFIYYEYAKFLKI
jgi:putative zinc finger/helix-turn-helix YgiT family protein